MAPVGQDVARELHSHSPGNCTAACRGHDLPEPAKKTERRCHRVMTAFGKTAKDKVCPPVIRFIEKPFDIEALIAEAIEVGNSSGEQKSRQAVPSGDLLLNARTGLGTGTAAVTCSRSVRSLSS